MFHARSWLGLSNFRLWSSKNSSTKPPFVPRLSSVILSRFSKALFYARWFYRSRRLEHSWTFGKHQEMHASKNLKTIRYRFMTYAISPSTQLHTNCLHCLLHYFLYFSKKTICENCLLNLKSQNNRSFILQEYTALFTGKVCRSQNNK